MAYRQIVVLLTLREGFLQEKKGNINFKKNHLAVNLFIH